MTKWARYNVGYIGETLTGQPTPSTHSAVWDKEEEGWETDYTNMSIEQAHVYPKYSLFCVMEYILPFLNICQINRLSVFRFNE